MPAPLAHRVAEDADAAQIARAVVVTWQAIDAALAPIIGTQGVAALYKRSLSLTAALHPWLADMPAGVQATMNLEALEAVFAQQGSGDAVVGGNALLQTFHQLLGSLVGPSLTERLLRSVWAADSSHGAPAQDTTP